MFLSLLSMGAATVVAAFAFAKPVVATASVSHTLLERASAIEGQNPYEAAELRTSALAFLSVA